MVERRQRRSAAPGAAAADTFPAASANSTWGLRLAYALVLVGTVSALAGVLALATDLGAMGNAGVPQGPLDFLPVVVGAALGVLGAALLVRGGLGVIRPTNRLAGGRTSALLGVLLQLPAALAVGALAATPPITVAYLALLAGLRVFSALVFQPLVVTNAVTYGALGTVLVVQSWLIGVGWVVYGGQLSSRWFHEAWLQAGAASRRGHGQSGGGQASRKQPGAGKSGPAGAGAGTPPG